MADDTRPNADYDESNRGDSNNGGSFSPNYGEPMHVTIAKVVEKQKAERDIIDPEDAAGLGEYVARAKANGTTAARAMKDYADLETSIRRDPANGVRDMLARLGYDAKEVAQNIYHGTDAARQSHETAEASTAIERFRRSSDPKLYESLKTSAIEFVESGKAGDTAKLGYAQVLQNAFGLAYQNTPSRKAADGIIKTLDGKDKAYRPRADKDIG